MEHLIDIHQPDDEELEYQHEEEDEEYDHHRLYQQQYQPRIPQNSMESDEQARREFEALEEDLEDDDEAVRIQYEIDKMDQNLEEEEDEDDFGAIKVLPRSKSDGELLQMRYENDYDYMEDSDQVSLHDDQQVEYPAGVSRVDYGMNKNQGAGGYLTGINMVGEVLFY